LKKIITFLQKQSFYVNIGLKITFLLFFGFLLYYEIFRRENVGELYAQFKKQIVNGQTRWFWLTLLLMPLNWVAETWKWLPLVRKVESDFSFWKGYKSILAGVTLSLFTPNRIGDYGGRILYVRSENHLKTVFATLIGSFAQQIVLISFGLLGLSSFLHVFWKIEKFWWYGIIWGSCTLITVIIIAFINIRLFIPLARRLKLLRIRHILKSAKILKAYTTTELFTTLCWATIRYLIYTFQYYFILKFFGIDAPFLQGIACIATIYVIQTSIPLPPVFGLLARGEIAIKIWSLFPSGLNNEIGILAATFTLWLINLIIPSLFGLILLLKTNFFKTKKEITP
jgi:uncharacterized membrane protein YbhN (UPF0104 family)